MLMRNAARVFRNLTVFAVLLFFINAIEASAAVPVTFYDSSDWSAISYFEVPGEAGAYNISAADLDLDSKAEIIVAPVYGEKGTVRVFRPNGELLSEFNAFYLAFDGGVSVDTGDFNGDGRQEMIVGAGPGGGPHVRILDMYGNPTVSGGFFAFDEKTYRAGISVAGADINGDNIDEIVVATAYGVEPLIRIFNAKGDLLEEFSVSNFGSLMNLNVKGIDLSGDGFDEIVLSGGYGSQAKLALYLPNGIKLDEYYVYNKNLNSGLVALGMNLSGEAGEEIVTAPGFTGGPHVRILNESGYLLNEFFTNHSSHYHGLNLAKGDVNGDGREDLITVQQATKEKDVPGRYVEIDLSDQTFSIYDNGYLVDWYWTSTGKASTPTRVGDFYAQNKLEMAYGGDGVQTWGMPKWIGFYYSGYLQNGIHALPYIDGRKEGRSSLGRAVSHGCVRLADEDIEKVYKWIKVGDRISVVR